MSQITSNYSAGSATSNSNADSDAFNDINLDVFLELMVTELQNQDPLNPMENDELLAQISQIREVAATDRLTETLDAVLLGQNVSSATSLIGADVTAMTDEGERVSGNVRSVTISDGQPTLDLAVDIETSTSTTEGEMDQGTYVYDVVWEGSGGELFGVQIDANTAGLSDFNGSVQIHNLPETDGRKTVYRTDKSGQGESRSIGTLQGDAANFLDTVNDTNRSAQELTRTPQLITFARKASVSLSNVAEINPPE